MKYLSHRPLFGRECRKHMSRKTDAVYNSPSSFDEGRGANHWTTLEVKEQAAENDSIASAVCRTHQRGRDSLGGKAEPPHHPRHYGRNILPRMIETCGRQRPPWALATDRRRAIKYRMAVHSFPARSQPPEAQLLIIICKGVWKADGGDGNLMRKLEAFLGQSWMMQKGCLRSPCCRSNERGQPHLGVNHAVRQRTAHNALYEQLPILQMDVIYVRETTPLGRVYKADGKLIKSCWGDEGRSQISAKITARDRAKIQMTKRPTAIMGSH
ncbi:hypothetical protein Bbelb_423130 [Branchiostoma belcheri]|nr:hypothetical protein Bbelb_423130 [Branchiostoma belcheri]